MDDILILAETRWKLKKAIRVLNQTFDGLKLSKHPDKTTMGRVERGFDFLGYHFVPSGLSLATQTLANCAGKALRLYEQEPPHMRVKRLGEYLRRWHGWAIIRAIFAFSQPLYGRCIYFCYLSTSTRVDDNDFNPINITPISTTMIINTVPDLRLPLRFCSLSSSWLALM